MKPTLQEFHTLTQNKLANLTPPLVDAAIQFSIDLAYELNPKTKREVSYLAAHLIILDRNEKQDAIDDGQAIPEETEHGPQKVKYVKQIERDSDAFYAKTYWGRLYMQLRDKTDEAPIAPFWG